MAGQKENCSSVLKRGGRGFCSMLAPCILQPLPSSGWPGCWLRALFAGGRGRFILYGLEGFGPSAYGCGAAAGGVW